MYTFDSRIRYSEIDSEGRLTLEALLNYFQDVSTFHSEDLGLGVGYLKEHHMVWVLTSWQIVVERYPELSEHIVVGTAPYDFKSFLGYRNFTMTTVEGKCLAKANTLWTLISTDTMKPTAMPPEMQEGYVLDPPIEMNYAPRKIAIPGGGKIEEPIVVKKHHLDTNHHVNNGQYVNMAMQYLAEGDGVRQMRAEYKKQAFLDEILYPYVACEGERCVVALRDAEDKVYVTVEFQM